MTDEERYYKYIEEVQFMSTLKGFLALFKNHLLRSIAMYEEQLQDSELYPLDRYSKKLGLTIQNKNLSVFNEIFSELQEK